MAGGTTDTWTRTFTVDFVGAHDTHTLAITEHGDGVNDPEVSATVDGLPIEVTVTSEMLIDGITPATAQPGCPACGEPFDLGWVRCAYCQDDDSAPCVCGYGDRSKEG